MLEGFVGYVVVAAACAGKVRVVVDVHVRRKKETAACWSNADLHTRRPR